MQKISSTILYRDDPVATVSTVEPFIDLQIEGDADYVPDVLRFREDEITHDDPREFVESLYIYLSGSYVRATRPKVEDI